MKCILFGFNLTYILNYKNLINLFLTILLGITHILKKYLNNIKNYI